MKLTFKLAKQIRARVLARRESNVLIAPTLGLDNG